MHYKVADPLRRSPADSSPRPRRRSNIQSRSRLIYTNCTPHLKQRPRVGLSHHPTLQLLSLARTGKLRSIRTPCQMQWTRTFLRKKHNKTPNIDMALCRAESIPRRVCSRLDRRCTHSREAFPCRIPSLIPIQAARRSNPTARARRLSWLFCDHEAHRFSKQIASASIHWA